MITCYLELKDISTAKMKPEVCIKPTAGKYVFFALEVGSSDSLRPAVQYC
jgi:hypothetical protein